VITGLVALLNPQVLDAGMLVMIGVVLDRSTRLVRGLEKSAAKVSGCMECHVVTGEFDYFMLVRTRDSDSFNRLHAEQLLHLPGVRQIRSFMVLKQVLSRRSSRSEARRGIPHQPYGGFSFDICHGESANPLHITNFNRGWALFARPMRLIAASTI